MRNSWAIFKSDWKSLGKNAISWVVVVGLVVIPSLYGWFCIYAFWDPYGHTEGLKVAVACEDEGYVNSLAPVTVNIGKEVMEGLRENRKLDWVFTDKEGAVEGVRSGEYYAALVIPKNFSRNLLSILSGDVQPAEILFYLNEKENAIAAKVTNQGAGTVQKTIDEEVAEKTSEIMLGFLDFAAKSLDDEDAEAITENVFGALRSMGSDLNAAADMIDALCTMNTTLDSLLLSTDELLKEIGSSASSALARMPTEDLIGARSQLEALSGKAGAAFQKTDEVYSAIDRYAAQYLQSVDGDVQTVSRTLNTCAGQVDTLIGRYQNLQRDVDELAEALPPELDLSRQLLNEFSVSLDRSILKQAQVREALEDAASDLSGISSDAVRDQREISSSIASYKQALNTLRTDYQKQVQPQIQTLTASLSDTEAAARTVTEGLRGAASEIRGVADPVSDRLAELDGALETSRDLLRDAAGRVEKLLDRTSSGDDSSEVLENLLHSDPGTVSRYLSSIVRLDSHIIYPVENFGSAMAPFYTSLAVWFGAIVLVAMLKADPSQRLVSTLNRPKNWQLYLGRSGIFLVLSFLQCLLLALGDLFFLGVSCAHPGLFVLTVLYTGFVFITLVYTLTTSFGNIGKALAVILLVFQVAGSGGTIPIEMTPPFFHRFYPLLPITHSMTAMRECIGGRYGNTLLTEYGILFLYVAASWLLGLVLRNPMIKMNHFFEEKVEDTKVM